MSNRYVNVTNLFWDAIKDEDGFSVTTRREMQKGDIVRLRIVRSDGEIDRVIETPYIITDRRDGKDHSVLDLDLMK